MHRAPLLAAALVLPASTLAGCTSGDDRDTTLTVLAASSLTDTFAELAELFEAQHDGVDVTLSFGSSTTLAEQVAQGAPGDVLATADQESMATAADAGVLHGEADAFATNRLVLVVPDENPAGIGSLTDLDELAGTDWVRCVPDAPCGKVTDTVLAASRIDAEPASLEVDVKAVVAKVAAGEADAGLVYASDALAAGDDVETIEIPGAGRELTTYYVATLTDDDLAAAWRRLVTSPEGRAVLTDAGFGTP